MLCVYVCEFPFETGNFIRVIESFSMVGGHEIFFPIDTIIFVLETDNQGNLLAFHENWQEDQWIAAKYLDNFKQVNEVNISALFSQHILRMSFKFLMPMYRKKRKLDI